MAVKKGGLGRGLDSLFADTGSNLSEDEKGALETLLVRDIEPDQDQPRKYFEDSALQELSRSISEHGILQPIVVRPMPNGTYKIIAGERRWRASRLAGLTEVPVIIKDVTDAQAMEIALIENLQREDLDPVEEALGYKNLMERCGLTQEQTAEKLSRSRSAVANSLRLLNLPEDVLEMLKQGELSAGHAKVILSLPTEEMQSIAGKQIKEEKLNVRQAEILCKKMQQQEKAPTQRIDQRPSFTAEVEISLQESLGTEVKVSYKEGKGTLNVGFYSDEQLKEFANLLGKYNQEKM